MGGDTAPQPPVGETTRSESGRPIAPSATKLRGMAHGPAVFALQADADMDASGAGGVGHFLCFGQITPQRPFAIDMLARRNRRQHNGAVFGHFDRHRDDIDIGIAREGEGIVIGRGRAEQRLGPVGNFLRAGGDGLHHQIGQGVDRAQMRVLRPTAFGIGPGKTDA